MQKRFFNHLLCLFTFALVVFGCSSAVTEHTPILNGKIANAPQLVLLERLDSLPVVVDTLKLSTDGTFTCTRKGLYTDFYRINIGQHHINLILNPDSTTTINFDYFDIDNSLSFSGYGQSALLQKVELNSKQFAIELSALSDSIKKLAATQVADSVIEMQFRNQESLATRYRANLDNILKGNESSLIAIPTLLQGAENNSLYSFPKDKQLFITTQYIISQLYSQSYQVKRFSSLVTSVYAKLNGFKPIVIGGYLPDIEAFTPWNERLAITSLVGKNVMVVVWSSQQPKCRAKNKEISKLMWRYRNQGLETYMISVDSDAEQWKKAIKEDDLNCLHVSDLGGSISPIIGLYGIESLPTIFLLNHDGKITEKNIWGEQLEDAIQQLVTQRNRK